MTGREPNRSQIRIVSDLGGGNCHIDVVGDATKAMHREGQCQVSNRRVSATGIDDDQRADLHGHTAPLVERREQRTAGNRLAYASRIKVQSHSQLNTRIGCERRVNIARDIQLSKTNIQSSIKIQIDRLGEGRAERDIELDATCWRRRVIERSRERRPNCC